MGINSIVVPWEWYIYLNVVDFNGKLWYIYHTWILWEYDSFRNPNIFEPLLAKSQQSCLLLDPDSRSIVVIVKARGSVWTSHWPWKRLWDSHWIYPRAFSLQNGRAWKLVSLQNEVNREYTTKRPRTTIAWIWSRVNVERYLIGVGGKHPPCWNSMRSVSKWARFIFADVFGGEQEDIIETNNLVSNQCQKSLIYLILIFLGPFSGCP